MGLSHQRIAALIREAAEAPGGDPFPEPEITLPNGTRLWERGSALAWFDRHPRRHYRRKVGS
jgi:hypothetical protein